MKKGNFETTMQKLEKIVHELEKGDLPLESALKKFEEGMRLSKECSEQLDAIEGKVTILMRDQEGNLETKPFDPDA